MKGVIFSLLMLLLAADGFTQDTVKYDYAILDVDIAPYIIGVLYSNGEKENLKDKLGVPLKGSLPDLTFRSFEYLNDRGYDLVTSVPFQQLASTNAHVQYIFKRKKILK